MKSLIIAVLAATGAVTVANAANYCSGNIGESTQVNCTSAGASHIGNGCSLAPKCVLTLCGSYLPPVGLPCTCSFENGRVGSSGAIWVQGPHYSVASNCVPYVVTVKRNVFEVDAALRFTGSLSPSSIVTLSDNEINCTKPNPHFGYSDRICSILLGDTDPMHLCAKSQLSILRNVVCAINPCALLALAAFAIACFTQILLQLAACCRCCENNCTCEVPPPCTTTPTSTTNPVVIPTEPPVTSAPVFTTTTETTTTTPTTSTTSETTTTTPTTSTTTETTTTTPTTSTIPTTTTTPTASTTPTTTTTPTTSTTPTTTTTPTSTTTTTTTTSTTSTTTTTTATTTCKPLPPCCACACGVELSIVVTISFSAVFAIESNCFDIIRGLAFVAPLIAAIAAALISFSFNKCVISRGDGVACRFHDIDACNGTVVTCQENSFESHDCPCIMECARPITLTGSAKFELCLNYFVSFGGSPQIRFGGAVSLVEQAKLLIVSNSMRRGDAEACDVPFFMFENFIQLAAGAEMSLSQNDCYDNAGSNKALLCALALGKMITPCATCPVSFCLNKYYDELLDSQEALGAAVTSALAAILAPISKCSESGFITSEAQNGAASQSMIVAVAALFAAAALLA